MYYQCLSFSLPLVNLAEFHMITRIRRDIVVRHWLRQCDNKFHNVGKNYNASDASQEDKLLLFIPEESGLRHRASSLSEEQEEPVS